MRRVDVASLIETCKLNDVNPYVWLADTLTKLVNRRPVSRRRTDGLDLHKGR
jgi:hypothetical protein